MWVWVMIFVGVSFLVGYGIGGGPEALKLGVVATYIIYILFGSIVFGLTLIIGYICHIRSEEKKLKERETKAEQALKQAESIMTREMDAVKKERLERADAMIKYAEHQVLESMREARERAEQFLRRQIEEEIEARFIEEKDKIPGWKPSREWEKKIIDEKRKVGERPDIFQASNGKMYARFKEGKPVSR